MPEVLQVSIQRLNISDKDSIEIPIEQTND
jgi:hypothetical protein